MSQEVQLFGQRNGTIMSYLAARDDDEIFTADYCSEFMEICNWPTKPTLDKVDLIRCTKDFCQTLSTTGAKEVPMNEAFGYGIAINNTSMSANHTFDFSLDQLLDGSVETESSIATCSTVKFLLPYCSSTVLYSVEPNRINLLVQPKFVSDSIVNATAQYIAKTALHQATKAELLPLVDYAFRNS